MFKRIDDALNRAETFMSGFEDDTEQEGVVDTLELIRSIQADIGNNPPAVFSFFVYIDKQSDIGGAFWSNKDGWGDFSNATVFSEDFAEALSPPITELEQSADRIAIDQVPAYLASFATRPRHGQNRANDGFAGDALELVDPEGGDYRLVHGRSVHIDVRNLSVQLSIGDDGLSAYIYARGTGQTLVETYARFDEASSVFFGDTSDGTTIKENIEENIEGWTPRWRDYVQSHLDVDPSVTPEVKDFIAESDQTWVNMDHLKDTALQTVAALPDPAFAAEYGIDPDAIRALQKLARSDRPAEIRTGLRGADTLILKAWESTNAPMELVYAIRSLTFTL